MYDDGRQGSRDCGRIWCEGIIRSLAGTGLRCQTSVPLKRGISKSKMSEESKKKELLEAKKMTVTRTFLLKS